MKEAKLVGDINQYNMSPILCKEKDFLLPSGAVCVRDEYKIYAEYLNVGH